MGLQAVIYFIKNDRIVTQLQAPKYINTSVRSAYLQANIL